MKKRKSDIFWIDAGCFNDQIIVTYNKTPEEILEGTKLLVRRKVFLKENIPFIEKFITASKTEIRPQDKGYVWEEGARCMLVLVEWDGTWENYQTLLHECVHLMQTIRRRKGIKCDETEAYLTEYFFRTIRKRLPQKG